MREIPCPICGYHFNPVWGLPGAPEDGQRELYCSFVCRDQAEAQSNQQSAARATKPAPESFPWDSTDPFAE